MNLLNSVAQEIQQLQTKKTCILIGIDGRSGSGKSSFAEKLQQLLPKSRIVHLDEFDFYEGPANVQRVINEVITPLKASSDKAAIVILEGIFALREDLIPYYDYKIWVDCPKEVGFERGLKRDIALNGIDNSDRWKNYWLPKEEEYITSKNPQAKADVVVDGTIFQAASAMLSEQFAVVYFPDINTEQIQALREKYDPHWQDIPPHITLVSPFSNIPEDLIIEHLRKVTEDMQPFAIHLHGLLKTDDNLLFLLAQDGRDKIILVHQQLYSGIFEALEQKYVFNPHITLGELGEKDINLSNVMYAEAVKMDLNIHTTFDSLSLIKGDGISPAKTIEVFRLE